MGVTIDFETRSVRKLRDCGAWAYACDPTTQVLCLAYTLGKTDEPKIWCPPQIAGLISSEIGEPNDLLNAIISGATVEAHNAFFERSIWNNIMTPRFGWPPIQSSQWRCSAAKAAALTLPRKLGDAATVMGLGESKDTEGQRLMLRLSQPKSTNPLIWWEDPEDLLLLLEYCKQDVRTERALSQALPDLSLFEHRVWQVDQVINMRGIPVDPDMAKAAIELAAGTISGATNRALEAANPAPFDTLRQLNKIKEWLADNGVRTPNLQTATIQNLLAVELPDKVRTVLAAVQCASKTSLAKYKKTLECLVDGRIRGTLLYHGASTGRWAGKLIQPQNFPRGEMSDPDTTCAAIKTRDPEWIDACYGPTPMTTVLSWATRGMICAPPGKELICADYAGVEARGLLWLAEDFENLGIFDRPKGEPGIYEEMAAAIYNVSPESIGPNSPERNLGKRAVLGLGYGMWAKEFLRICRTSGLEVDIYLALTAVDAYRDRFRKVADLWAALEIRANMAVAERRTISYSRGRFYVDNQILYCVLPSGRKLAYLNPKLEKVRSKYGGYKVQLTYDGVNSRTRKWARQSIYGGKWAENITSAICRDLEAAALVRLETGQEKYSVIMHTHDEIVSECDSGRGDLAEYINLITERPDWADGFPLSADGWIGKRYRK